MEQIRSRPIVVKLERREAAWRCCARVQHPKQQISLRLVPKVGPELVQTPFYADTQHENQGSEQGRISDKLKRIQMTQAELDGGGHR